MHQCAVYDFFWQYYEQPERHKRISKSELNYIQKHNAITTEQIPYKTGPLLKKLFTNRKVWGLMIGFTGYGYTFNLLLTWLPTFFKHTYGMDLMSSGLFTAVPWLISTIFGIAVGVWLVDYFIKKGYPNTKVYRTVIIVGMSFGFFFLGSILTNNITVAIICISIGLAGISATAPVGWSIPRRTRADRFRIHAELHGESRKQPVRRHYCCVTDRVFV